MNRSETTHPLAGDARAGAAEPRVLILTASVGAGHDLPAATLSAQLREERAGVVVVAEDALAAVGGLVKALSADAAELFFFRFRVVWDVGFWLFARCPPTRRATQALLAYKSAAALLRRIECARPDVVVSTYPNMTEVLGRLRRAGRLDVPVCSAITDLAALDYWATRGVDVHLVTHPESIPEVRRIAGPDTRVTCVHGFTSPDFRIARSAEDARRALGLPEEGAIVLVSGGGWGVGDVLGAVAEALELTRIVCVVCLCGTNEALRRKLLHAYADEPRVRIEGFTDLMPEWMAASDVVVHATCGLTVLEAHMRGCAVISYGWGRGHIRVNDRALRRSGLGDVVRTRRELGPAILRAIARPRRPDPRFAEMPSAASIVLELADEARTRREAAR